MVRDALEAARGELGRTEAPAGSNRTKYGAWYGLDGQPWCMMFVQWCYAQAGTPLPYKTASCGALLRWYQKNYPEKVLSDPQSGDIAIYNFGHTGIVESAAAGTVTAIEGNTSSGEAGSQNDGGGVFRRTRRKTPVTAYIRPFDGDGDRMDKETFKRMWLELREELQDNGGSEYSKEARAWAVQSGIIQGGGSLPDGSPNYMWEDLLTREQMAVLLYRFARQAGLAK